MTSPTASYGFDASGSLTTLPTGTSSTTYDNASELTASTLSGTTTSYSYNADGEQTQQSIGGSTTVSAGYSGAEELTSYSNSAANMSTAGYDGDGLRQSVTSTPTGGSATTQNFTWDISGLLPRPLMDSTNAYIYGPGATPVEQVDLSTGAIQYLVSDRLGSVRGIVSSSGALTATTSYDAWGNPQTSGGLTSSTPIGYAGAYTDLTGRLYLIARYYDPQTGQFISVDPLVGVTGASYAYANGDPVDERDPLGLCGGWGWVDGECEVSYVITHPTQMIEYAAAGICVVASDGACLVAAGAAFSFDTVENAVGACSIGDFAQREGITFLENGLLGGGGLIKAGLGAAGAFGDWAPTSLLGNAALNLPSSAASATVTASEPRIDAQLSSGGSCGCG